MTYVFLIVRKSEVNPSKKCSYEIGKYADNEQAAWLRVVKDAKQSGFKLISVKLISSHP